METTANENNYCLTDNTVYYPVPITVGLGRVLKIYTFLGWVGLGQ